MKRSAALQAVARAKRWSLAGLAQRQLALGAEQDAGTQRLHALEQDLADAAGRQRTLLAGASFSATDLVSRRRAFAVLAGKSEQARQHCQALATQAEGLAAEVRDHRQEQALLERVLDRRDEAEAQAMDHRAAREADALVAARGSHVEPSHSLHSLPPEGASAPFGRPGGR